MVRPDRRLFVRSLQPDEVEVADQPLVPRCAEGERVPEEDPEDGDDAHGEEVLHEHREHVLGPDHPSVEERQTGCHEEDECRGGQDPRGVARIDVPARDQPLELCGTARDRRPRRGAARVRDDARRGRDARRADGPSAPGGGSPVRRSRRRVGPASSGRPTSAVVHAAHRAATRTYARARRATAPRARAAAVAVRGLRRRAVDGRVVQTPRPTPFATRRAPAPRARRSRRRRRRTRRRTGAAGPAASVVSATSSSATTVARPAPAPMPRDVGSTRSSGGGDSIRRHRGNLMFRQYFARFSFVCCRRRRVERELEAARAVRQS